MRVISEVYNVSVELVTYQWPAWLHQETEKQRVIWGYKILFLDVLFPLTVKKVIYVDADQVVRADMKELWELDLHGAPLGYTPFCDSRTEMDGFRFWKSGYWKNHLGSKPYHIRFGLNPSFGHSLVSIFCGLDVSHAQFEYNQCSLRC